MWKIVTLVVLIAVAAQCAPTETNPCKDRFEYQAGDAAGTWGGILNISTEYKLYGTWIRVIFDGPVKTVTVADKSLETIYSKDTPNQVLLKSRDFIIQKNLPIKIPFTVTYDGDKAPALTGYRLNGRDICPGTEE